MPLTAEQLANALMQIDREFHERPLTPAERRMIDYEDACAFARRHARRLQPSDPNDVR